MPFGRVIESLGRASLRTIQVITNPFRLNLVPIKKRLLLAIREWYAHGIIDNEDIDKYLCDMVGEFNQWTQNSMYEETVFRGYVKTPETTYYSPGESSNSGIKSNNTRRVTKPWI